MRNVAIKIINVTKIYTMFDNKSDRLKEALSFTRKKYHSDFYALNNISLEVRKGETLGIIGQNGSGKSTLLKILSGVLTQTSGEVQVNGRVSALLELGAGFNPEMTGLENIYLNGTIMGYTRAEMEEKAKGIIEFADIGEFIYQPVKLYSSGMFARLGFAVAINVEPEILIVDEVLSVGDMKFQLKCMNQMRKMIDTGTTIIFVSHEINSIRKFCSRAIWIDKGILMSQGDVNMVADQYLSYLKLEDGKEEIIKEINNVEEIVGSQRPFSPGDNIAEIIDFKVLNRNGEITSSVEMDEYIKIEVTYDVYDVDIKNPVLGIAFIGIDNDYICGLNTLLDGISIPWKYGRNKFQLEYTYGLRALGGDYYFDVGLFDETVLVSLHYISKVRNITIASDYKAEGRYVIPHSWRCEFYE